MEIEYERNLAGSYMKAAAAGDESFDEKIMLKNKMPGLLKVEKSYVDGKGIYWYDISGYQSLAVMSELKKLDINFIEKFILTLCDQIEILERNLMDIDCLLLDPDTIFVSNQDESIRYVIYPEVFDSLSVYVRDIIEFMLTKLDHGDKENVQPAYDIYQKTLDADYSILDIREMILKRRQEAAREQANYETIADAELPEISPDEAEIINDTGDKKENAFFKKLADIIEDYLGINIREWSGSRKKSADKDGVKEKNVRESRILSPIPRRKKEKKQDDAIIIEPEEYKEEDKEGKPEQTYEPVRQIHPTVCLTDYREHPQGLLLYEGYEGLGNISITGQETRIGQSEDMDAVIAKSTISRIHASIAMEEGEFYLSDMNSSNGTFVNDKPVAYREKRRLKSNDIVRFADVKYRFV